MRAARRSPVRKVLSAKESDLPICRSAELRACRSLDRSPHALTAAGLTTESQTSTRAGRSRGSMRPATCPVSPAIRAGCAARAGVHFVGHHTGNGVTTVQRNLRRLYTGLYTAPAQSACVWGVLAPTPPALRAIGVGAKPLSGGVCAGRRSVSRLMKGLGGKVGMWGGWVAGVVAGRLLWSGAGKMGVLTGGVTRSCGGREMG